MICNIQYKRGIYKNSSKRNEWDIQEGNSNEYRDKQEYNLGNNKNTGNMKLK